MRWSILCYLLFISILDVQAQPKSFMYPETKKVNVTDTFFGNAIGDPYRWLETQNSSEIKDWVTNQNKFTRKYLDEIPNTFTLQEQIKRNTETQYFSPTKRGKYFFSLRRVFGGKEMLIYYTDDIRKGYWEELFISKDFGVKKDQVVSIDNFSMSKDAKYIAYTFNTNGSDWKEIKVADLEKQKSLEDHLYDVKMSSIVWRGNGFYYTKLDRVVGAEYVQAVKFPKLYYHKLGTAQDKDSLIFKRNDLPYNFFSPVVTRDERFLIIEDCNLNTNYKSYYYYDFNNPEQKSFLPLIKKTGKVYELLASREEELLFCEVSRKEKKITIINPTKPNKHLLVNKISPELILRDVCYYNGKFFELCYYNQQEYIVVVDEKNEIVKKVEIPFGAYCSFSGIDEDNNELIINYGSILHPPVLASINLNSFKFEIIEPVKISYDMSGFVVEKIMYKSDTVLVPLLLMHKKKIKLDGNNPTLIEFYGGYGTIHMPSYDAGLISFVENGGIYAYAMIRGGGEKGDYWEKAGSKFNRQNSVNDIINASVYLSEKGYAIPEKIAITGGSHGGFMAMAATIKAPEKFGAVIPRVGVYDMLRFEKFTIGSVHEDEHGTVKDSVNYLFIKSLSPLHNVAKGKKYPPILFMTSDYDDRVPPLHSYKMAATMQELVSKENPILLRVEKNAGHNGARSYEKYIDETTDFYSFLLNSLGVDKYK